MSQMAATRAARDVCHWFDAARGYSVAFFFSGNVSGMRPTYEQIPPIPFLSRGEVEFALPLGIPAAQLVPNKIHRTMFFRVNYTFFSGAPYQLLFFVAMMLLCLATWTFHASNLRRERDLCHVDRVTRFVDVQNFPRHTRGKN